MNGKQVRLFLVEGSAGSLMTAEIMNWTGHLIAAPTRLAGRTVPGAGRRVQLVRMVENAG